MKSNFKLIFIGNGAIGCPLLKTLSEDDRFDISLVITQKDRPVGRKLKLTPGPIKVTAEELSLTVFQPENINSESSLKTINKANADAIILISYGQILSEAVLHLPKFDSFNVHGSILPKYRGASPIQQALLNCDSETGITLMKMVKAMDAGSIYEAFKLPITGKDNTTSLSEKLAKLTAEKVPDALFKVLSKNLVGDPQNESEASYCEKISKSDGLIRWNEAAKIIEAKIKAYAGWPGTYTFWNKKRLKIIFGTATESNKDIKPGFVFSENNQTLVKCGENALLLKEVQLEGKKSQSIKDFINGYPSFTEPQTNLTD